MGKRKKKRAQENEDRAELTFDEPIPRRRIEALGVTMMLAAVGLCFALFSFDPSGGGNLVGPLGARIATVILGGIGVVGYLVALLALLIAGATLLGKLRLPSLLTLFAGAGMTLGATVLANLLMEPVLDHQPGGLVGYVVSEAVASVAGPVGAGLFGVGAVLIGLIGIADVSIGAALRDAYRLLRYLGAATFGRLGIWWEARRAGRAREEELVEAARSRRAIAKMEADARERALREQLEEKARHAVLKATAKAEERALAKIAAQEAKERLEQEQAEAEAEVEEVEVVDGPSMPPGPSEVDSDDASEDEDGEPIEAVSLDIPGPGAEPDIVIAASHFEAAADVIDEIDRSLRPQKQLPPPPPEDEEEPASSEDEEPEDEEPEDEEAYEEAYDDDEEEEEEEEVEAEEDDGPRIHDRLAVTPNFDDLPEDEEEKQEFHLPPINLLDYEGDDPEPIEQELLRAKALRLEEKLRTYGVEGKVTAIRPGPVVTTYEYQPAPGVKVSKIANLSDDIAMSMEALRVRIVAPIPGRGVVGIELPNDARENVYLKELIAHDTFKKSKSLLTLALGKCAEGNPVVRDLRKMPHFLIAGTTGSGKSVSINTMICSILYKATPDQVKFIMVDPKMLELSLYEDIPHLLLPVVTDPRKASLALAWAVDEMERRYQLLSDAKVRDIDGFNKRLEKLRERREDEAERAKLGEELPEEEAETGSKKKKLHDPWRGQELPEPLPYIVVLIDEFADLMCVAPRDVEGAVQRLAQKARAAGIHVLLATQRPSTDVITGVIKNNFPSRISFRVASRHDSATILNNPGAENLLGMGDSLVLDVASPMPERVHGGFVSETEVERVVEFWKAQAKPQFDPNILKKRDEEDAEIKAEDVDEMYDKAVQIVTETRKASISALQRKLRVGYNRAARMVEMMEMQGIVGPAIGPKGEREILVQAMGPDGPSG